MTTPDSAGTKTLVARIETATRAAIVQACWEQWRLLGAQASAGKVPSPTSIVDPEALVLLTLAARDYEHRLDDFLGWWADTGATLLSVQRLLNLAEKFPEDVRVRLGAFASLAAESGDRRWRRHRGEADAFVVQVRPGKGAEVLSLTRPPALWCRLRAGFGVGTKADLLTLLIGLDGAKVSVRDASHALAYTDVAVRSAAEELARARFIDALPDRPARYAADSNRWSKLLDLTGGVPMWRSWAQVFAFLASVDAWGHKGRIAVWSDYVWSSRARDLADQHALALADAGLPVPDGAQHPGARFIVAFADFVEGLAMWVEQNL